MNGLSDSNSGSKVLVTCCGLLHLCKKMYVHMLECRLIFLSTSFVNNMCQCERKLKKTQYIWFILFALRLKQLESTSTLFLLKIQLNIALSPYTSQFHSWKQSFMIIKFRCAVWLHAVEQPTACDLILQTFGWVKGNMVSHKMLINVEGTYNKEIKTKRYACQHITCNIYRESSE